MLTKAGRTPFVRDNGGFVAHINFPGLLKRGSRDHGIGPLAMVVESVLDPGRLIAMHEHQNDEIISWVPDGVMRHDDKAGGKLVVDARHLMVMNAGSSFWHSEEVLASDPPLRMLQILVRPDSLDLEPGIQFGPVEPAPAETWRHLFGSAASDAPFLVRNRADFYDIRLEESGRSEFPRMTGRTLYFYVFSGTITAGGRIFREAEQGLWAGDGVLGLNAQEPSVVVAFLIDEKATITREGTVGDHPKIPPVWVLRLAGAWFRARRWWKGLLN